MAIPKTTTDAITIDGKLKDLQDRALGGLFIGKNLPFPFTKGEKYAIIATPH